jgi:hypothetical protein
VFGEPDEQYIRARTALLDAADALAPHLASIVLVGAQAIYLHTGSADLAIAEFTTDADFSVEPGTLSNEPILGDLLRARGFTPREHPGGWLSPHGVYVDIMVPETVAGKGKRSADLGVHGKRAARRAAGLEGALVDRDPMTIIALDHTDVRTVVMNVAGPAALIVAKLHKLWERTQNDDRVKDKDALDVFRLLQSTPTIRLASRLAMLRDSLSAGPATTDAIGYLGELFGTPLGRGVQLAVRATANLIDEQELRLSLVTLTEDLLRAL